MARRGDQQSRQPGATHFTEGLKGVKAVSPNTIITCCISHWAAKMPEARFFLDNMAKRNVPFDVIGLSYYPKWHGTLTDLKNNMADLAKRYKQQVMVAEYSQLKKEVNDIAFNVPDGKAVGELIYLGTDRQLGRYF